MYFFSRNGGFPQVDLPDVQNIQGLVVGVVSSHSDSKDCTLSPLSSASRRSDKSSTGPSVSPFLKCSKYHPCDMLVRNVDCCSAFSSSLKISFFRRACSSLDCFFICLLWPQVLGHFLLFVPRAQNQTQNTLTQPNELHEISETKAPCINPRFGMSPRYFTSSSLPRLGSTTTMLGVKRTAVHESPATVFHRVRNLVSNIFHHHRTFAPLSHMTLMLLTLFAPLTSTPSSRIPVRMLATGQTPVQSVVSRTARRQSAALMKRIHDIACENRDPRRRLLRWPTLPLCGHNSFQTQKLIFGTCAQVSWLRCRLHRCSNQDIHLKAINKNGKYQDGEN